MFDNLEKYYKKNSQQIKFRKRVVSVYALIIASFLVINSVTPGDPVVKTIIFLSLVIIITIITAKISLLLITHDNKKRGEVDSSSLAGKDYALIKNYFRNQKLLKKEPLGAFKNHYLAKVSSQKPNYHTEIMLAIITIFTSFISSKDYTSEAMAKSILLSTITSIGLLIIYFIIKSSLDLYNFYTGTDDLYETLEDFTTQLYLETIHKDNKK